MQRRLRKRLRRAPRGPMPLPEQRNEVWVMDFVHDGLADYQRIARKAVRLRELGLSDRLIAARRGITGKTVSKGGRRAPPDHRIIRP